MVRTKQRELCSDDEDWSNVEDFAERRRIQNRNNQRAHRRRRILVKQARQSNVPQKLVKTFLLPKPVASGSTGGLKDATSAAINQYGADYRSVMHKPSLPTLKRCGIYDMTGIRLSAESCRIFQYASTCLWPSFAQEVVETGELLAEAMTRLALTYELVMETFIWTAAAELEMHSSNIENLRVMLQHQTNAMRMIRKGLGRNDITDPLIFAIYAMATSEIPTRTFTTQGKRTHENASVSGDFSPLSASLGRMDHMSKLYHSEKHAQAAISLLEPRGGLESMEAGLADQMQAMDLFRSSQTGATPSFNFCHTYQYVLTVEMPLSREDGNVVEKFASPDFEMLFSDLRYYLRQVDLYLNAHSPHLSAGKFVTWRNINQHRVLSLPVDTDQLLRIGVLIFSYVVLFPVPSRDPLEAWMRELVPIVYQTRKASGAAMWAIAVAAMSRPDAETFGHLVRAAKCMRRDLCLESWSDLNTSLRNICGLEALAMREVRCSGIRLALSMSEICG